MDNTSARTGEGGRLPVTVCLISGPEERRIGQALASVVGWVEEIVVVMNEDVADGTEEICRKHGAKIFREPWKGHVAQKNSAAQKATQPWLLGLDADEIVSEELRRSIQEAVKEGGGASAYQFARLTWFSGRWIRHGDWYPDWQTRLWKREGARWGGIDPHDRLEVDGPVARLSGDLLHLTSESLDRLVGKHLRYADIFVRECSVRNRHPGVLSLAVRPAWRFVRSYFLRLGFLDGWQGLSVAWMGAFYTYLRYAKALEANRPAAAPVLGSSPK